MRLNANEEGEVYEAVTYNGKKVEKGNIVELMAALRADSTFLKDVEELERKTYRYTEKQNGSDFDTDTSGLDS